MKTGLQAERLRIFFGGISGYARKIPALLTFSAADERLRLRKVLSISLEKGAVSATLQKSFLLRTKIVKTLRLDVAENEYPRLADVLEAVKSLSAPGRPAARDAVLVMPEEWIIRRDTGFPAVAAGDIRNAVLYELDRLLPFGTDRMFYGWQVTGGDRKNITVRVSAVKAEKAMEYMDGLRQNGIAVTGIICPGEAAGPGSKTNNASKALNLLGAGERQKRRAPVAVTAFLLAALLAIWAHRVMAPARAERARLDSLTRQVWLEKNKARSTEEAMRRVGILNGEVATIKGFNIARPAALRTLKKLTALIPRSAWLTSLDITGNSIRIEGYASSAAALIPRLEKSGFFKKVQFASPTLRDAKTRTDHFVIKMAVENGSSSGSGKKAPGEREAKK